MRLLIHICCGPCASATIGSWRAEGVQVAGVFFNPNIHPLLEYRRRLEGALEVGRITGVEVALDPTYDPEAWFSAVSGTEGTRCRRCIGQRLERTAAHAAVLGYEAFSTTLSISPWQDHDAIRSEGARAGGLHGVDFVYEDLRPLYPESRKLSREWGLYRQKYCGCLVSEWERYRDA